MTIHTFANNLTNLGEFSEISDAVETIRAINTTGDGTLLWDAISEVLERHINDTVRSGLANARQVHQ